MGRRNVFTEDVQADMVRRYTQLGQTLSIIALAHSTSPTAVSRVLAARKVAVRRNGAGVWKLRTNFSRGRIV